MAESESIRIARVRSRRVCNSAAASAHFAAAAADRGPVAFDCGGFGLGANRSAVAVEIRRFAVAAGLDHVPAGFALAADHFVAVAVAARF